MASAADIMAAREWVGSSPADDVLGVAIDAADSPQAAALSILTVRRADFVASASSLSVAGHMSYSTAKNIEAIDADIARLRSLISGDSGLAMFQLSRSDRARS